MPIKVKEETKVETPEVKTDVTETTEQAAPAVVEAPAPAAADLPLAVVESVRRILSMGEDIVKDIAQKTRIGTEYENVQYLRAAQSLLMVAKTDIINATTGAGNVWLGLSKACAEHVISYPVNKLLAEVNEKLRKADLNADAPRHAVAV